MESTRHRLIELLANSQSSYISGQELSKKLNISRTAVWKHMKELEKDGYKIEAFPKKGYQITQFPDKLSSNTLLWGLHTNWLGKNIIHKTKLNSTQILGNQLAAEGEGHGTVIIADEQTNGRGRMERSWYSARDKGIWMSIILRPGLLPNQAPQLTLLTATVLADVLSQKNISVTIKWPNDILINGKKAAGILTEMQAEQDQIKYVVLGIGLNLNQLQSEFPDSIKDKATSLRVETNKEWDRKELIHGILEHFDTVYDEYMESGFENIRLKWVSYGYKIGEAVDIVTPKENWSATLVGIESDGALIVRNQDGSTEVLYSAEIKW
ncbi:biotin--[acetyl-CoA-carboxylase] ligase [Aquibacillus kalidii]|uniref:biotin--[acetyl-CoA-carboxylase] ligase n=1 Tax=Aquibacillus kalidii TaxID=2762597 RepID=UPI0016454996|nr:biotin--[acetyl-CoA-carboxylase] ligase [Aquibacillus kalidii]